MISPSQIAALVTDTGVGVITDNYKPEALYFPRFCEVITPEMASDPFYGDKSTTLHFGADPVKRADGQKIEATTGATGYAPQGKIDQFSRSLAIPKRVMEAADAKGRIVSMVSEFVAQFSRGAALQKDQAVADILNYGSITAGNLGVFDGSYPGHVDPYPTKIYDGVSFFNAAHPLKFGSGTYDNHESLALGTTGNLDLAYTRVAYTNAVDENGKRILIRPDLLIVPPALRKTALALLNSELVPGSANNDINTERNLLSAIIHPLLTDTDGWFLGTKAQGIRVIDSGVPGLSQWYDEATKCYMVSVEYHFGAYVRDWRGWLASNTATS